MDPVTPGIISNVTTNILGAGLRKLWNPIRITQPRPQEVLSDPQLLGAGFSYAVKGTLRTLPKHHAIWVLTESESDGRVWPQGFFPVQYDPQKGEWFGRVNGDGFPNVRLLAVVAPPTSIDYFNYFQKLGRLREYKFEPLARLPPECTNVAWVQTRISNR